MSSFEEQTDYRKNVVYLLLDINIALSEIRISSKINVITFLQTKQRNAIKDILPIIGR